MRSYCFDLDGTLCETDGMDYEAARPIWRRIERVNVLYERGHHITIDTARGPGTGEDWYQATAVQLARWGVQYDELRVGEKPVADEYIDDRGTNVTDWEARG